MRKMALGNVWFRSIGFSGHQDLFERLEHSFTNLTDV
jgi:hypothetical protein